MLYKNATNYIPDTFKIGKYKAILNNGLKYNSETKTTYGACSCKWLLRGDWTEVSQFARVTNGYKPGNQRDAEKQIKKEMGCVVDDVKNDFRSGFRIIGLPRSYDNRDDFYMIIYDPAGFVFSQRGNALREWLFDYHLSIDSAGVISGRFRHFWTDRYHMGIVYEGDRDLGIAKTDESISKSGFNSKKFSKKDLVPGTVYDVIADQTSGTTARYLYAGQFKLAPQGKYITLLCKSYWLRPTAYGYWTTDMQDKTSPKWPWNNEQYKELVRSYREESDKLRPVFIALFDTYSAYDDDVVGSDQNRMLLDNILENKDCDYAISLWPDGKNIDWTGKHIKNILKVSDNQTLKIDLDPRGSYYRSKASHVKHIAEPLKESELRIYTIPDINEAISEMKMFLDAKVDDLVEENPVDEPCDEHFKYIVSNRREKYAACHGKSKFWN